MSVSGEERPRRLASPQRRASHEPSSLLHSYITKMKLKSESRGNSIRFRPEDIDDCYSATSGATSGKRSVDVNSLGLVSLASLDSSKVSYHEFMANSLFPVHASVGSNSNRGSCTNDNRPKHWMAAASAALSFTTRTTAQVDNREGARGDDDSSSVFLSESSADSVSDGSSALWSHIESRRQHNLSRPSTQAGSSADGRERDRKRLQRGRCARLLVLVSVVMLVYIALQADLDGVLNELRRDENLLGRLFGNDLALEEKEAGDSPLRSRILPEEPAPKEVREKITPAPHHPERSLRGSQGITPRKGGKAEEGKQPASAPNREGANPNKRQ